MEASGKKRVAESRRKVFHNDKTCGNRSYLRKSSAMVGEPPFCSYANYYTQTEADKMVCREKAGGVKRGGVETLSLPGYWYSRAKDDSQKEVRQ
jgi:hypothetical protein